MPSIESGNRLQKALLWNLIGYDPQGENVVADDPIEILVRADIGKGSGGGAAIRSTMMVDRSIEIGSIMKLGSLEDWLGTGSVESEGNYLKVASYHETRDIKNRGVTRQIMLELYRGTPPSRD